MSGTQRTGKTKGGSCQVRARRQCRTNGLRTRLTNLGTPLAVRRHTTTTQPAARQRVVIPRFRRQQDKGHGRPAMYPPPLVQATVNDQKLLGQGRCLRGTLCMGTCGKTWCTILTAQGQDMPQRPSCPNQLPRHKVLTPCISKPKHQDPLKNAPPKSTVRKLTEPTPGAAWARAFLGQAGMLRCNAAQPCAASELNATGATLFRGGWAVCHQG